MLIHRLLCIFAAEFDVMEVIYFILGVVALYWIYKAYGWIKFKNKYPILSPDLPKDILEIGDYVSFGNSKVRFLGINKRNFLGYVFEQENSVDNIILTRSEMINRIDAVYGRYGLKWKRV